MTVEQVRYEPKDERPVRLGPELSAIARFLAWYERTSVADVCAPYLEQPLRERLAAVPDTMMVRFAAEFASTSPSA